MLLADRCRQSRVRLQPHVVARIRAAQPSTIEALLEIQAELVGYESNLRAHVLPAFGSHQLRHVDRMAVEQWVADLQAAGLGPSGVRQARQVLNSMMMLAVNVDYVIVNPVSV